jgi:uncharacterized protein DUF5990
MLRRRHGLTEEKIVHTDEVRFRLLRSDDVPATNPLNLAYQFGLQDIKGNLVAGTRQASGILVFDFILKAKVGKEPARPVFTGPFASGPVDDRFVYLSWRAIERGDYINRVKARLATIDWRMIRASQEKDLPITADMTGWSPGDARKHVTWYLH